MSSLRAVALVAASTLAACAHDVHTRLPSEPGEPTGSITVIVTQPARDLTIAVNGVLVAERRHTKKVRVDGVPTGAADVVIAAGAGGTRVERHVRVQVEQGRETAIPIGSPSGSASGTALTGFLSIAAWVLSRAAYIALL
jgi:hypothetical protein